MPEGDTVYRAAAKLDRALTGHRLTLSDFRVPAFATVDLREGTVIRTLSRGKHLLTRVEGEVTIHSHLKMEGRWDVQAAGSSWHRPAQACWSKYTWERWAASTLASQRNATASRSLCSQALVRRSRRPPPHASQPL